MKTYRVTLKYCRNGHTSSLSTTIPAYHDEQAIDLTIDANNLAGSVVSAKAEEVTN